MGRRTTTDKLSDLNREVGEVKEARKTQDLRLDQTHAPNRVATKRADVCFLRSSSAMACR